MKNLFKLLIIFMLSLFVSSCSDGDSDSNNNYNTPGSFLVEYNGVKWGASWNDGNDESSWVAFSPDGAMSWYLYMGECETENVPWGEESSDGSIATVQENTNDRLVLLIRCISDCDDGEGGTIGDFTLTFTVSGSTLSVVDSDLPDEVDVRFRDDDGGC